MKPETIPADTAMPTVRIDPQRNVESMRIKSAEVELVCSTCPTTLTDHADLLFYEDATDFEANVRANSDWATDEDPGGNTCLLCQAQARKERSDR